MTTDPELPDYADIAGDTALMPPPLVDSMGTTSSLLYKSEFMTGLQDEAGYAWLLLRVKSRSPSAKTTPFFVEGDTISGTVELNPSKTDSVKAVSVEIQAGTTAVGQEEEKFLLVKETLWNSTTGGPRMSKEKEQWSFAIALPKEVEIACPNGQKRFYQLPPSFSERASPAYLDYRIVVTIKRGMFKVNQTLTTTFVYQPITVPESPPTPLMRLAYAERSALPNPKQDAEGWNILTRIEVEGILFSQKKVEVACQLSIGRPLQYALGSPIPLHLVIESDDEQALEVLSDPKAVRVELVRAMTIGNEAIAQNPERRSDNFFATVLGRGYFWGVDEPRSGTYRRILHGEVNLEMKLKPTFVFPGLSIEYVINFAGFEATGWNFKNQSQREAPLMSESVKITSRQLAGVVMRSSAPPGFQKPEGDYNRSLGYLENGNQRFLHHHGW